MMDMWLKTNNLHRRDTENSFVTTGDNESNVRIKKMSDVSDLPIRKKRKYNEEFIKFCFTWIGDENESKGLKSVAVPVTNEEPKSTKKYKLHRRNKDYILANFQDRKSLTELSEVSTSGFKVPKGSTCFVLIYFLHRYKDVFPDPEKFDPDRYLPENSVKIHENGYIPFSAGPINCIGNETNSNCKIKSL
ncbi:hypothetical protein NPIL_366901 [Nephila pilipes]|uniref:Cytochrome P450 n=1 Tax=Nephila pilipes TaxID=299642 RepID=A0A8X6Q9R5_NEPPI|nr:hypothetical protein NPIL_366901 [Nephila pilipes]